jgi:NAD(P)-dependent dehydrogenase (short-subunit alcohol dehydrogenase family)
MTPSLQKEQYLAGKVAIVTGAAKHNGIGFVTALALAEHGANVCTASVANWVQAGNKC